MARPQWKVESFISSSNTYVVTKQDPTLQGPDTDAFPAFVIEADPGNFANYPLPVAAQNNPPGSATPSNSTNPSTTGGDTQPHDTRLTWRMGSGVVSLSTALGKEAVEGMQFSKDPSNPSSPIVSAKDIDTKDMVEYYSVPSIMNPNAYIVLSPGDNSKESNKLLIDQDGKPKWYEYGLPSNTKAVEPTTANIIEWSLGEKHKGRIPYKYSDFVFCKYWNKIPNNYLITLRRYPFPVLDNLQAPRENSTDYNGKLAPVATAITWLGESNKISEIFSFDAGLNWKDVKADVWTVTGDAPGSSDGPLPGLAKALGIINGEQNADGGQLPPDPYSDGPYANKIIGPVNVISEVKSRERGLFFKQSFTLTFEYTARPIGGVNTKAVMLDIMANLLMLSSASATFWGGMNRFRVNGTTYPFLGGEKGAKAWYNGNPSQFFDAVSEQFSKASGKLSQLFSSLLDNPNPLEALKSLVAGGAKVALVDKVAGKKTYLHGLRSILTGDPVGEWHLTIGNPLNPTMMIGNLICTGVSISFNDELGPDDFPTELKAVITLEHGMPRDNDRIGSMFNSGNSRIYSLPKNFEQSFFSSKQTPVDSSYTSKGNSLAGGAIATTGSEKANTAIYGDPNDLERIANTFARTASNIYGSFAGKMSLSAGNQNSNNK